MRVWKLQFWFVWLVFCDIIRTYHSDNAYQRLVWIEQMTKMLHQRHEATMYHHSYYRCDVHRLGFLSDRLCHRLCRWFSFVYIRCGFVWDVTIDASDMYTKHTMCMYWDVNEFWLSWILISHDFIETAADSTISDRGGRNREEYVREKRRLHIMVSVKFIEYFSSRL